MKISERDALNIQKPQSGAVYDTLKPASGSPNASKSPATSGDQIDLGGQSELLSQLQNAGSDARATLVEQLRAAVQSGQYQVDSGALSQSIVDAAVNGY